MLQISYSRGEGKATILSLDSQLKDRGSNSKRINLYYITLIYIIITIRVFHSFQRSNGFQILCSVLRYLSVTIVTLYPVRHDRYMIVKVHSYVKVVLLIPSIVL